MKVLIMSSALLLHQFSPKERCGVVKDLRIYFVANLNLIYETDLAYKELSRYLIKISGNVPQKEDVNLP
jgi:hypothetical protein